MSTDTTHTGGRRVRTIIGMRHRAAAIAAAPAIGYGVAVIVPIATILVVTYLELPAFVFEHLVVLLVVGVAVPWGMGPAVIAAGVAAGGENLLLREPVGRLAITDTRNIFDLALFMSVAIAVGWLVAKARREQLRAEAAAEGERQIRQDRDRLVSMITHDLATPLAAIRGTVQFARRFGKNAEIDVQRLLGRIEAAALRATSLTKSLADARAIDHGDLALVQRETDLRDLVVPSVQMLHGASERHQLTVAMPEAPVMVRCDEERLQRVIENLLSNAIKYSPAGGPIELSVTTENSCAVLSVRDSGIGISSEARPRIFERSYRAPEAIATAPGLGLGLSISAEIVKRHGGVIETQPADPRGSVFTLRLPLLRKGMTRTITPGEPLGVVGPSQAVH